MTTAIGRLLLAMADFRTHPTFLTPNLTATLASFLGTHSAITPD